MWLAPEHFPGCLQVTESLEKFLVKYCRDGRVRELEKEGLEKEQDCALQEHITFNEARSGSSQISELLH